MSGKKSYSITSNLIRESRERNYKTAKEFWQEHHDVLKVSYPHYASVEAGTKFPDIELAVAIAKTLKLDLKLVCHAWAKDQMPSPETKAFFEPTPGKEIQGVPTTLKIPIDDYYVFTERQIPALKANPKIWDILSFIMAFDHYAKPTEKDIAKILGYSSADVKTALEWLRNEGLVTSEGGKLSAPRRYHHLPNTIAFKETRDSNYLYFSQDVVKKLNAVDLMNKEAYRTTFLRRITRKQAEQICERIDDLVAQLGNMQDVGSEYYALTIAFGSRAKWNKGETKQIEESE